MTGVTALEYAGRGWPVPPCRPGSKTPHTDHGLKDATTDTAAIEVWWRRWRDAWIGVPTDERIRAVVLDVDVKNDSWGFDSLDELSCAIMSATPMAHIPSGGLHIYFGAPGHELRNTSRRRGCGIGPGLDWCGKTNRRRQPGRGAAATARHFPESIDDPEAAHSQRPRRCAPEQSANSVEAKARPPPNSRSG